MDQTSATITFHSSEFFTFDPSRSDEVEYFEVENRCMFRVPVTENDPTGSTIKNKLEYYAINLTRPAVPLVNGKPQDLNYVLQPGDEILMLFQISGG